MKFWMMLLGCCLISVAGASVASDDLVKPNDAKDTAIVNGKLMLHFSDYHSKIHTHGKNYLLDSYVVFLEQPFYIHVRTEDKSPITQKDAQQIAISYIEPKGCTEPLEHRPELDKTNANHSQWIIGVAC